jgi:hypothetical protein
MTTATPEETPATDAKATVKKDLTAKEWARVEALWERGEVSYSDLVKKYGKSVSTFERHFRKRGIKKGAKREAVKKRVEEELAREDVNDAQVLAARIRETKEEHYKMAAALGRLTWNEILQAKRDGRPVATALPNLKALDGAMTILKKAREEKWAVLGLDRTDSVDPDLIPELIISELTAEQVKQLRDRDHTEVDDAETVQTTEGVVAELGNDDETDEESEPE